MTALQHLTDDDKQALDRFRARHGRYWKAKLRELWLTGSYRACPPGTGYILHGLRNRFGPTWLDGARLAKVGPEGGLPQHAQAFLGDHSHAI